MATAEGKRVLCAFGYDYFRGMHEVNVAGTTSETLGRFKAGLEGIYTEYSLGGVDEEDVYNKQPTEAAAAALLRLREFLACCYPTVSAEELLADMRRDPDLSLSIEGNMIFQGVVPERSSFMAVFSSPDELPLIIKAALRQQIQETKDFVQAMKCERL
jgi:hypothetical protein